MRNEIIFFLLLGILQFITLVAQPSKYYFTNYGWEGGQNGIKVLQKDNGNYLMGCNTLTNNLFIYLIEITPEGVIVDTIKNEFEDYQTYMYDMLKNEEGFFIVGHVIEIEEINALRHSFYSQLDDENDFSSKNIVGILTEKNRAKSCVQTVDDGYILAGFHKPNPDIPWEELYLIRLSSTYEVQWDTTYANLPYDYRSYFNDIIANPDGTFHLLATVEDNWSNPQGKVAIMHIDSVGEILNTYEFDLGTDEQSYQMIRTLDGGILFSGITNQNQTDFTIVKGYIYKLAQNLEVEWIVEEDLISQEPFLYTGITDVAIQLSDSSFLLGNTYFPEGASFSEVSLVKISSNGELLWQRSYGIEGHDYIYDLIFANNDSTGLNGFVACGRTEGVPNGANALFLKTNCMGLITLPVPHFEIIVGADPLNIILQNQSQYTYPDSIDGGYYLLNYGEGNPLDTLHTDSINNYQHTYAQNGIYTPSLTAIVCNDTATYSQILCLGASIQNSPNFSYTATANNEQQIQFSNQTIFSPSVPNHYANYQWLFGDESPSNTQYEPEHTYEQAGVYNVTLQSIACNDTVSYTATICVGTPSANFSYTLNSNGEISCTNYSQLGNNFTTQLQGTYTWFFGDDTAPSNELHPTHTYAQNGIYPLTLQAVWCEDTLYYSEEIAIFNVGVGQAIEEVGEVLVYPNPASSELVFASNLSHYQAATIEIYSITGKLLQSVEISAKVLELDVASYANGLYFYTVRVGEELIAKNKFTIIH